MYLNEDWGLRVKMYSNIIVFVFVTPDLDWLCLTIHLTSVWSPEIPRIVNLLTSFRSFSFSEFSEMSIPENLLAPSLSRRELLVWRSVKQCSAVEWFLYDRIRNVDCPRKMMNTHRQNSTSTHQANVLVFLFYVFRIFEHKYPRNTILHTMSCLWQNQL